MSMRAVIHHVVSVSARASREVGEHSSWVDLYFVDERGDECEITVWFSDRNAPALFANAINTANALLHAKKEAAS